MISWDGNEGNSDSESSMGSLEEIDMDDRMVTPGSRKQTPDAPDGGGNAYNTHAHGEALGGGKGEHAGAHGGAKTPPISPKNQEVADVFKAFVDDESEDDSSGRPF